MTEENNPLLCDMETGMCEIPEDKTGILATGHIQSDKKPLKVIYYTDPICSSCWGIEPQLRKLKLEYGHVLEIEYRMGGLLPDWSYNSGGIRKPADVAHHWDEVSGYYNMPIDGDIWLEDPLHSSYPPSIAFKAAQLQNNEKAIRFLREIREMVFLQKKNIARWEHLEDAANIVGLNIEQFKADFESRAKELFIDDLKLGKELGVRGFPTMFFTNATQNKEIVFGAKPYSAFENAVLKLMPFATKYDYLKNPESLFEKFNTLTAREFSELSETLVNEGTRILDNLTQQGVLEKVTIKNGSLWKLVK